MAFQFFPTEMLQLKQQKLLQPVKEECKQTKEAPDKLNTQI